MTIWYYDKPRGYEATLDETVRRGLAYPVVAACYSFLETVPACRRRHRRAKGSWHIMVCPVERRLRQEVQELLVDSAFSAIDRWLRADRTETWFFSSKKLECVWHPTNRGLTFEEAAGI